MTRTCSIDLSGWTPRDAPREYDAGEIIDWALQRFVGWSAVMTSSFNMEGIVLLDLLARRLESLRVITVDTGFLFEETHELREKLKRRFPAVQFRSIHPRLDPRAQAARFGSSLWKRDPDLCCRMRKVEPMHRAMQGVDLWFAALRRDQSDTRAEQPVVAWDWQFQVIKVCPLATWSRPQVYAYLKRHDLPYNTLHDREYPSVGCTHCTRAVPGANPWTYSRDGRWAGRAKTECGLHAGTRPEETNHDPDLAPPR